MHQALGFGMRKSPKRFCLLTNVLIGDAPVMDGCNEDFMQSQTSLHSLRWYVMALRATTKSGRVEAGCCATLMRRAAPWPETSSFALCAAEDKSSRHVRRVASRLPSPPLAPDTNAASAAH